MSYSHTQKRKTIARLKRKFGDPFHPGNWYPHYRDHVEEILKERERKLGPPITLEQIIQAKFLREMTFPGEKA